ncbi:MAG: ribosome silencing factor [Kiritimatiellae bacterium]|nr:ribosome silencing factor [Kiritimatiellia bacterium]
MDTAEAVETVRRALEEKKAEDVAVYDVRGRSSVTDATVAASATSAPHLRALAVAVERAMAAKGERARVSGDAESAWIVLDYADLMVHLFLPDARRYYDIESLWKKA